MAQQDPTTRTKSQILCIGSPMWDTYLFIPEEFIPQSAQVNVELRKGDATKCIDYTQIEALLSMARSSHTSSSSSSSSSSLPTSHFNTHPRSEICPRDDLHDCGGCVVNTAKVLASLGSDTALIGTRGDDVTGSRFVTRLKTYGVLDLTITVKEATGEVLCFVTPDAQRTFAYFPGASSKLAVAPFISKLQRATSSSSSSLSSSSSRHVASSSSLPFCLTYVDCYTFLVADNAAERMVEYMKSGGAVVALNTGSVGIVTAQVGRLRDVVVRCCDLVLANDEESAILAGSATLKESTSTSTSNVEEAACCISRMMMATSTLAICIVTIGKAGCYVAVKGDSFGIVSPLPKNVVADPIDTTGAGDFFSAGFLHAWMRLSQEDRTKRDHLVGCIRTGQRCASLVISRMGTRFDPKEMKQCIL